MNYLKLLFLSLFTVIFTAKAIPSNIPSNIILVTGGSGYIGSATVLYMVEQGYKVIVVDKKKPESAYFKSSSCLSNIEDSSENSILEKFINKKLKNTNKSANKSLDKNVLYIQTNLSNKKLLDKLFKKVNFEAVIHFAAFIEVGRSISDPESFYKNNVINTYNLLSLMKKYNVKNIVFSSSAAVYGVPESDILPEYHSKKPISPYGKTKYMIEMILQDYAKAYGISSVSLRYFNAAGALPEYNIGERHEPETHIIPLLLKAAFNNSTFSIFGDNYLTKDGTCVRDYLHIWDIAQAHYLAFKYFKTKNSIICEEFNLGTGVGYSIKEIITLTENITKLKVKAAVNDRRAGDPKQLIADPTKANKMLNWRPVMSSIDHIISSAYKFYTSSGL